MRALLMPVKDLRNAKQRLAHILSPQERFELANAMLLDVVCAVRNVQNAGKIFVVTNYEPAICLAVENGWQVIAEERQISESVSIDAASRFCADRGVTSLLRLPLDLPLIQSSDIEELLAVESAAPAMTIVPSRDGSGTNAILRTPPCLFPSHFGPNSFAKHCCEAELAGARISIHRNPRLEMDVDDESDLRALLQHDSVGAETARWLHQFTHAELAPGRGFSRAASATAG